MLVVAALGDSFRSFFDAVGLFFENLAAVSWGLLALGLLLHASYVSVRTRAWFNALRAAYPGKAIRWRDVWAAYTVGFGVNSVVPARAGEVARLYLARQRVPDSSYPALASSFLVEAIFDAAVGALLIVFAFTQGVLPDPPDLTRLPGLGLSWVGRHPELALFLLTLAVVGGLTLIGVLSVRVRAFWTRIRQGLVILRDRRRYVREVVAWQVLAWALRFAGFWLILAAFGMPASVRNVLLVLAVQSMSTLIPITPQGAGAQQALLVVVFAGLAAGPQVAAYSVGQQIAIVAVNVALGFAALALVFGTTDWRGVIRRGQEEREAESARGEETTARLG
jgi:glycosyltransferase 2 family protein